MNSFDVTSGTIDAAVAIGFYALVVFGGRNITHRIRKTEPNPTNNKWLWLSALGLAAAVLVGGGSISNQLEASGPTRCEQVHNTFDDLSSQLEGKTQAMKATIALRASHVIANDPQCYSPGDVASAQAYIDKSH